MTTSSLVSLQQAFDERRTIYALGNDLPVDPRAIVNIAERVLLHTPSAFNSQSSRLIVLFGEQHKQVWDIAEGKLRQEIGDGDFVSSKQKMDSFRAGAGTVLFYEDKEVTKSLQDNFALYADKFPLWAHQTSAMHQYAMWTELRTLDVGASLQHYNPLIDEDVAVAFSVPKNWDLIAQMPFGNILEPAGKKTYQPLNERMKVFGLND
ncbi:MULTISPECIES: nitroreductase family protein [unclassified Psychrobacter]|uniref:nitroreductase family protein n=1 Tax=unclassified Psychrobacter TaxID=196806 RepID=UPI000B7E465C|nr:MULTISPECIES: nitroreductase family protein [unclassified Psychrobacter]MDE4454896.1 nitroreductase family protein [Psychrobacter sp. DAB_AL62B]OXL27685.1 nitroreductase family protein [Psychrobacter sp. DAB_AL32B]